MVSKSKKETAGKKKKIKVLNLNKETVKNLTDEEAKGVKGGTTQCIASFARRGQPLVAQSLSGIGQISTTTLVGQSNSGGGFNP